MSTIEFAIALVCITLLFCILLLSGLMFVSYKITKTQNEIEAQKLEIGYDIYDEAI